MRTERRAYETKQSGMHDGWDNWEGRRRAKCSMGCRSLVHLRQHTMGVLRESMGDGREQETKLGEKKLGVRLVWPPGFMIPQQLGQDELEK